MTKTVKAQARLWSTESLRALTSQGRGRINCTTRIGLRTPMWEAIDDHPFGQGDPVLDETVPIPERNPT
jgi:hypothetical protein